jgi:hypothetical protein
MGKIVPDDRPVPADEPDAQTSGQSFAWASTVNAVDVTAIRSRSMQTGLVDLFVYFRKKINFERTAQGKRENRKGKKRDRESSFFLHEVHRKYFSPTYHITSIECFRGELL